MTTSTHWIYVGEDNRVYSFIYSSHAIVDPNVEGKAYNFDVHDKNITYALWDDSAQTLTFDSAYNEFHSPSA